MTLLIAILTTASAWAANKPKYCLDYCLGEVENIIVGGWAFDPDVSSISIDVHVYIYSDEACMNEMKRVNIGPANVPRPDVNTAYNITGDHGFRAAIPVEAGGPYYVRVYAIDATGDSHPLMNNPYTDVGVVGNIGEGTTDNPFIISNDSEWYMFADLTTDPNTAFFYSTCSYKLDTDIGSPEAPVMAMFGTADNPFSGTFYGDSFSLWVNIDTEESPAAPFRVVSGATIRELNVSGRVAVNTDANNNHAGGLVGYCKGGTTVIDECNVATRVEAHKYAGGIVGHGGETGLVIRNSIYSGTIAGFTKCAGGLVGWCDWLSMTLSNCLMKGSFEPGEGGFYHPVALTNNSYKASADADAVYYTNTNTPTATTNLVPGADGTPVSETLVPGEWTVEVVAADGNTYYLPGTYVDVTFAEGTEDVENWSITPETPEDVGATVTLTYSGRRQVENVDVSIPCDGDLTNIKSDVYVPDGATLTGTYNHWGKITIADGAVVTLQDFSISSYNWQVCPWAGINCEGDAIIILKGTNYVEGFHQNYPGIHVPEGHKLTIRGNGSLEVVSNGFGAGIGGGKEISCGNIRIEGGTITARGGCRAAAVGGGENADCGDLTFTGGIHTLTAIKDSGSLYSIGPGTNGSCGTITVGKDVVDPIEDSCTLEGSGSGNDDSSTGSYDRAVFYIPVEVAPGETANTWTFTMPTNDVVVFVEYESLPTSIEAVSPTPSHQQESWYTLDGRKLNREPSAKGVYIKDGRTVLVK